MKIPSTITEATDALTGIESLLTKKGWERAAIISAFVRLDNKPGPRSSDSSVKTPTEFAELGIAGLRSHVTIRSYVQNWLETHDGIYPEPGADVLIPETDYPPRPENESGTNDREKLVQKQAEKGTLVEKLTPEQRIAVAAEILRSAEDDERDSIEEQADIMVVRGNREEATRAIRRSDKAHAAATTPIVVTDAQFLGDMSRRLRSLVNHFIEGRPYLRDEIIKEAADTIAMMNAEAQIEGTVRNVAP